MKILALPLCIVIALFILPLSAEEGKIRIAVSTVSAINTSDSDALLLEELLTENLYASPAFAVLEKSQMEVALKKNGITPDASFDLQYLSHLGNILNVDKMITGSVNASAGGTFTIHVKSINIRDSSIDIVLQRTAKSTDEFASVAQSVAAELERYYHNGTLHNYRDSFSAGAVYFLPRGPFRQNLKYATGLSLDWTHAFSESFALAFSSGFYRLAPDKQYIDSFYMIPLATGVTYRIQCTPRLTIKPFAGAGYLVSQKIFDRVKNRSGANYEYSTEYYYNPLLSLRCRADWRILDRAAIYTSIDSIIFFESSSVDYLIGASAGVSIMF